MKEILIFCQAPADIKYALALRKKYPKNDINFITIHVRGMYSFIKECGVNYKSLRYVRRPKAYCLWRFWENFYIWWIIRDLKRDMARYKNARIYFFSPCFDWLTSCLLDLLSQNNEIIYLEHDSHKATEVVSPLKDRYGLMLMRLITGSRYAYGTFGNGSSYYNKVLYWVDFACRTEEIDARAYLANELPETLQRYRYELSASGKSILIFDAHLDHVSKNSDELFVNLIEAALQEKLSIYVKYHPRLGGKTFYKNYDIKELPSYVPGEFIDLSQFDLIFSFCSTALAEAAKNREGQGVYSLFTMLDFTDEGFQKIHTKLLEERSGGYMNYIKSLNELDDILKLNSETEL